MLNIYKLFVYYKGNSIIYFVILASLLQIWYFKKLHIFWGTNIFTKSCSGRNKKVESAKFGYLRLFHNYKYVCLCGCVFVHLFVFVSLSLCVTVSVSKAIVFSSYFWWILNELKGRFPKVRIYLQKGDKGLPPPPPDP